MEVAIRKFTDDMSAVLDDPAPSPRAADSSAAARFSGLLNPQSATDEVAPVEAASSTEAAAPAAPRTLGDNILGALQNASSEASGSWTKVTEALHANSGHMSMSDMLKLQLGMTEASIHFDLIGKAVGRTVQNLDQLVKLQ